MAVQNAWLQRSVLATLLSAACLATLAAAERFPVAPPADFSPDPASVIREGSGYRYTQSGWIVLHIEGEPYERGYQHGKLLAAEIAEHIQSLANVRSPKAPGRGLAQACARWSTPCSCGAMTPNTWKK